MPSKGVQFRYAGRRIRGIEVPGICLAFFSQQEAEAWAEFLRDYLAIRSDRSLRVEFVSENDHYKFLVEVRIHGEVRLIEISGIASSLIRRFRRGFSDTGLYFLIFGFGPDDSFEILEPRSYHVFSRVVSVDGKLLASAHVFRFDLDEFFEGQAN